MVKLSPKDSSILTRITQYERVPMEQRRALLDDASPEAKQIGEIILGTSSRENASPEIKAAVDAYRKWLEQIRRSSKQRPLRRSAAG